MDISCIISVVILTVLLMVFMVCQTSTCGPGARLKTRPTNFYVRSRQPPVPEDSKDASGKFENPLMRNDSRLRRITSTQIVFADKGYESNCRKAIKPCKDALLRLADAVATHWSKKYKLRVTAAYKEQKSLNEEIYKKNSLHLEGRAFDLELIDAPGKKRSIRRSSKAKNLKLPTLAGLAYYEAYFTFVEVKRQHIHVSCSKKERKSTGGILGQVFSRCFPGDAYVRSEKGKIQMKDLQLGEKVLAIDSHGNRVYSEIVMMMHRQVNVTVDDYVKISTDSGDDITLSSHHLIPIKSKNSSDKIYIFSKDVKPSQFIFVYSTIASKLTMSRVVSVQHVKKTGAYAPLTVEGTLVVNDIHVSCYALFPSHTISHYVFSIWRTIYTYLSPIVSWPTNTDGYHWYPNMFRIAMNMLPILPYEV